jgi:hypothetical protein
MVWMPNGSTSDCSASIQPSRPNLEAEYTRNGHDWTRQFKVILPQLRALTNGSALIDGEIIAIDSQGRTNFSL